MTVDEFIAKWEPSGGNERANTQLFITDLCVLLGVEAPQPTLPDTQRNDYVFEKHVIKTEIEGSTSNGWIDLYKRAMPSSLRPSRAATRIARPRVWAD